MSDMKCQGNDIRFHGHHPAAFWPGASSSVASVKGNIMQSTAPPATFCSGAPASMAPTASVKGNNGTQQWAPCGNVSSLAFS